MWLSWIWEGFVSGVMKVLALWWLLPLFVLIQLLKDSGWLGRASRWMAPLLRPLRLPDAAGLPIVAGLAVGLTYGAGVLIQTAEEGKLTRGQLTVMCVFLGICHALIEETILFTAVGSNGLLLIAIRIGVGALAAWILARFTLAVPPVVSTRSAKARA
ncbi:MAG: nucleoside recognition domain-containing protein [Bacillota bacterium]